MSRVNRYIAQDAAVLKNPLTFSAVSLTGTDKATNLADIQANIDVVLAALAKEGTDPTDHRLYLDEMSPAARNSMYRIIADLRASITAAA